MQDLFSNHPALSSLSLADLSATLHNFQSNPFYSFFTGVLQENADAAMASIVGGFNVRDKIAILEREQTIGAAPAYLKFSQLVNEIRESLTEQLTKQNEQQ